MDLLLEIATERKGPAAAKFAHEEGCFLTSREVVVSTKYDIHYSCRKTEIKQAMTYLGRVTANVVNGPPDFDGFNPKYVSSDGMLLVDEVWNELEDYSRMSGSECAEAFRRGKCWSWVDNQVSLLMNMLRYSLLKKCEEVSPVGLKGKLPVLESGGLTVDPNFIWDDKYPEGGEFGWPHKKWRGSVPTYKLLSDYVPDEDSPVIDLAFLEENEAKFVLFMCSGWSRQSRFRIDYELESLAPAILYRTKDSKKIDGLPGDKRDDNQEWSGTLSAHEASIILEKYVAHNNLLVQMNVARDMIFRMYCQYLPQTIDGVSWLQTDWFATIPLFRAIRNRFSFLTRVSPYVAPRRLAELHYFGNLETYNFAGICICQAIFYGLAVRVFRYSSEDSPQDLIDTEDAFHNLSDLTTPAIAEVVAAPVPRVGMIGIGVKSAGGLSKGRQKSIIWAKEYNRPRTARVKEMYTIAELEDEDSSREAWHQKKPELSYEERAANCKVVPIELDGWPLPGLPVYIRRATGQKGFKLLDDEYVINMAELNVNQYSITGSISEIWKLDLILRLMGWETEVNMLGTSESRVSFAYTVDGNIPIPPNQILRDCNIAITAIRSTEWSARIPNLLMTFKGMVVEVSVDSECENIYSNVEGLSEKTIFSIMISFMFQNFVSVIIVSSFVELLSCYYVE